jgi:hypothetical protein
MPPDNTVPLVAAAHRRHETTRGRALEALRDLDRKGTPITFETVARTARVSRSWLYSQPDIRIEIARLREATRRAPAPPIPARQRASDSAILARLEAALDRNRKLTEENQRLRHQLAQLLGERRVSTTPETISAPRRTNPKKSPTTIGPC